MMAVSYGVFLLSTQFLPDLLALLPTLVVALASATVLKRWLDHRFDFYPQDTAARQAAFAVAQNETRLEAIEAAFLGILQGWGQVEQAIIITGAGTKNVSFPGDLSEEELMANALRNFRWVTPERLVRERSSPDSELLGRFL